MGQVNHKNRGLLEMAGDWVKLIFVLLLYTQCCCPRRLRQVTTKRGTVNTLLQVFSDNCNFTVI